MCRTVQLLVQLNVVYPGAVGSHASEPSFTPLPQRGLQVLSEAQYCVALQSPSPQQVPLAWQVKLLPVPHFFCAEVQPQTCALVHVCVVPQSLLPQQVPLTQVMLAPLPQVR